MPVQNVVLVHGAFADGSSWSKVIPLLSAKGHRVMSVAIPLTSYAEDVAATKRAIAVQEGPVLLVGHSLDALRPLSDGYLQLTAKGVENDFAQDLSKEEKALLVAVQPQTAGAIFDAKPRAAAWKSKPSWYVIAGNDRMIAPEQEQAMAQTIRATTTRFPSSHAVMLSHPKEVATVIADAAQAVGTDRPTNLQIPLVPAASRIGE